MSPAGLAPGGSGTEQVGLAWNRAPCQGQADIPSAYRSVSLPRQGFEPISPPPRSAASSSSFPVHFGVAVSKAEPLNKVKALPEVVEGSSEDEEEEEVDHELVEKKVQILLGTSPLWFPTAMARCLWRLRAFLDAHRDLGIIDCSSEDITRHSGARGLLLDACGDREHCHILRRDWDIARCLQGPGALSGACRTWESHQMLLGTISRSSMLAGTGMFPDAHRDSGHPLGAHGV